jgi:Zn-finger nucleic acid-binding protein
MKRHNYRRISGVIIDTCPQHGTFLDTGELQALEAFIRAGGMAAASRHQEKETQRLADTERRADRMVQTLRDGAPGTFFGHRPGHLLHKQNSLCLWMNSPLFDLL